MPSAPQYFNLLCLTPVHVGTGVEYISGVDLVVQNGKSYLLDSDRVLETLYAANQLPRDPEDLKSKITALLRRAKIEDYALSQSPDVMPENLRIRAAIRTGDGCPMIPGSSIKGALRTVLFAGRLGTNGPHSETRQSFSGQLAQDARRATPRSRYAAQRLEELVFRSSVRAEYRLKRDAKADLLRMCSVSDASFGSDSVRLVITAAMGTMRYTIVGAEVLAKDSSAAIDLRIASPDIEPMFTERLPSWHAFADWSRSHAAHLVELDLSYFATQQGRVPRKCGAVIQQLEALRDKISKAESHTMTLRVGWGTGWRTMTGDLLGDEQRKRLLPQSDELGPKTRKVIVPDVARDAPAVDILGWISLVPISESEAIRIQTQIQRQRLRSIEAVDTPLFKPEPPLSGDTFTLAVAKIQAKNWGQLADFYHRALADPAQRDARLAALGAKVAEVWKDDERRLRQAAEKFTELARHLAVKPQLTNR